MTALLLPSIAFCSPADSDFSVRLKTELTSYNSKPGDPFECVVISPWISNGAVVIPEGSIVHGHVGRVTAVGLGIRHERARMELVFDTFVTADGRSFPLQVKLIGIDNAREQVKDGAIRGVLAASQPNRFMYGIWHWPSLNLLSRSLVGMTGINNQICSIFSFGPIGAGGVLVARLAFLRFPEPEIQYTAGVDFWLEPDPQKQKGVAETPTISQPAPNEVAERLQQEPFGLDRPNKRPVSDIVNVAFLGSRDQITHAFEEAGWSQADARTTRTTTHAYSALNAMRAYASAPVSPLFYKGAKPDVVFEKSLNTITKRHHIRVWYAGVVDGSDLWLGAATHDIGGTFNLRSFKFSHAIDPLIDHERDKVATDLRFAGCTEPAMRVHRPAAISDGLNGTKNAAITDGAVTVLQLKTCETTVIAGDIGSKPGNQASRLARRMILEARNHVYRDNPYYWTYQLIRYTYNRSNQPANALLAQTGPKR